MVKELELKNIMFTGNSQNIYNHTRKIKEKKLIFRCKIVRKTDTITCLPARLPAYNLNT